MSMKWIIGKRDVVWWGWVGRSMGGADGPAGSRGTRFITMVRE